MACVDQDQEPSFKHHCRICKKGFMCGRALGGHMRAHGIGDETTILDDEDLQSDGEEKLGASDNYRTRSMYRLRTNPNRFKSVRICENCGKEFLSWKSFLEHGKCGSDDAESLISSPNSEAEEDDNGGDERATSCGGRWSKRKRSLRAKVDSFSYNNNSSGLEEEEEDLLLARCLIDLANSRVDFSMGVEQQEESSASASREEERRNMMAFLSPYSNRAPNDKSKCGTKGLFECKACKKVFNSHQALGGHRASHKKVKGCYAAKQDQIDNYSLGDEDVITQEDYYSSSKPLTSMQFEHIGTSKKKSKVHECTICHRVFSTGQALGGHKRCHWITSNTPDPSALRKYQIPDPVEERSNQDDNTKSEEAALDLNLPAQVVDEVSTEMHLLPLVDHGDGKERVDIVSIPFQHQSDNGEVGNKDSKNNIKFISNNVGNCMNNNVVDDDEADSKKGKLAKLSELKDMNVSCSSSQWLQVGIGSTTNIATSL